MRLVQFLVRFSLCSLEYIFGVVCAEGDLSFAANKRRRKGLTGVVTEDETEKPVLFLLLVTVLAF